MVINIVTMINHNNIKKTKYNKYSYNIQIITIRMTYKVERNIDVIHILAIKFILDSREV